jgi:hypothetical protein
MSEKYVIAGFDVEPHFWMILQQLVATRRYDTTVFRMCCTEEYDKHKSRKVRNPEVFRNCFTTVIGELRDVYIIRREGLCLPNRDYYLRTEPLVVEPSPFLPHTGRPYKKQAIRKRPV